MTITSPAFKANEMIPEKHTCDGADVSPGLIFHDIPDKATSFALIMDDPDAPGGTWVHWVLFNMGIASEVCEGEAPGIQGKNDFGRSDYGGPCPPSGTHRYYFRLYALDKKIDLSSGALKTDLLAAMKGHILMEAQIIGLYRR